MTKTGNNCLPVKIDNSIRSSHALVFEATLLKIMQTNDQANVRKPSDADAMATLIIAVRKTGLSSL